MTTTTARAAIIAKLAAADITPTQTTRVDLPDGNEHGDRACHGEVEARFSVADLKISLTWLGDDGSTDMPHEVYSDLDSHSDTDEIEEAIKDAFDDADVTVDLAWAETSARVTIEVSTHTVRRNGDGGGIGYSVSTRSDDLTVNEADSRAECNLAHLLSEACADRSITGYEYPDGMNDTDRGDEAAAREALITLGAALGLVRSYHVTLSSGAYWMILDVTATSEAEAERLALASDAVIDANEEEARMLAASEITGTCAPYRVVEGKTSDKGACDSTGIVLVDSGAEG